MASSDPETNPNKENENKETKKLLIEEHHPEGFFDFVKTNTRDTAAYLLLILGLVLLFFEPLFGGILIGLVAGIYFSQEINRLIYHANNFIEEQGMVRSIIFGITTFALFISAPGIFIGGALSIALKHLFGNDSDKDKKININHDK